MSSPQVDTDSASSLVIDARTLMIAFTAVVLSRLIPPVSVYAWRSWTTVGILSSKSEWLNWLSKTLNNLRHFEDDEFLSEASLERMKGFSVAFLK
jgi:hypothetical protein